MLSVHIHGARGDDHVRTLPTFVRKGLRETQNEVLIDDADWFDALVALKGTNRCLSPDIQATQE